MSKSRHNRKPCVCPVDFDRVNQDALARSRELISALLPGGVTSGSQYVIPRPASRRLLSIFLDTGRWSDFAIVAHGDDLVGFVAHALRIPQRDAARLITAVIGTEWRAAPDGGEATEAAR
jgi:hypothetical protein